MRLVNRIIQQHEKSINKSIRNLFILKKENKEVEDIRKDEIEILVRM